MPNTFLFEAGFWGLPFGSLGRDPKETAAALQDFLEKERLPSTRVRLWYSANRFGFVLEGLPESQAGNTTDIRGPKASAAYDSNSQPAPAALGFAKKLGRDLSELVIREVDGEKYLFGVRKESGKPFAEIFPTLFPKLLDLIPWGLSPWQTGYVFPHPVQYICSMVNDTLFECTIDGVKSATSSGLFESGVLRRIAIPEAKDFQKVLSELGILPIPPDRQKIIESNCQSLGGSGSTIRMDRGILEKLSFAYENPKSIVLDLGLDFSPLPISLLNKVFGQAPLCLPFETTKGGFLPRVVSFINGRLPTAEEHTIRAAALREKLSDHLDLWNDEIKKTPEDRLKLLKTIPGRVRPTMYDEAQEVTRISNVIADCIEMPVAREKIEQAIFLMCSEQISEARRRYPDLAGSFVPAVAASQNLDPIVVGCLKDCEILYNLKEAVPSTIEAWVVAMAFFFWRISEGGKGATEAVPDFLDRILNLTIGKGLRVNLLKIAQCLPGSKSFPKELWIEGLNRRMTRENMDRKRFEWILTSENVNGCFDPVFWYGAVKTWSDGPPPEREVVSSLHQRILAKVGSCPERETAAPPTAQLEIDLDKKLTDLENLRTADAREFVSHLIAARVDIEACLMDLPAVCDDANPANATRLHLLKRVLKLISKVPFFITTTGKVRVTSPQKEEKAVP